MNAYLPQHMGQGGGAGGAGMNANFQQIQQYGQQQEAFHTIRQQEQLDAYYQQLQNNQQHSAMMNQQDLYGQSLQSAYGQQPQQDQQQQQQAMQFPGAERYNQFREHINPQGIMPQGSQLPSMDTRQPWEGQQSLDPGSYSQQGYEIPKSQGEIDFSRVDPKEFKKYVLYYSPSCRYCKNILAVSAIHPDLDDKILKINVDNYDVTGLKGVPTIVEGGRQFLGNQALLWMKQKGASELKGLDLFDSNEDGGYCALDNDILTSEGGEYCLFEKSTEKTVDFQTLESIDGTGRGMGTSAIDLQLDALKAQRANIQVPKQASHIFYGH